MPYKPTIPTTCLSCGIEFLAARPAATRQPTKYCTRQCAYDGLSRPLADKFWERTSKTDGCWPWTGHRTPFGHGMIGHRGTILYAHRISWEIHHGPIPTGIEVCHRCDVPFCVRPDHLFLGTQADNLRDAQNKGRMVQPGLAGSKHPMAKLVEADIRTIRELGAAGLTHRAIAQQFSVSHTMIGYILRGHNWTHLA